MDLDRLLQDILKFNQSKPNDGANDSKPKTTYRGNQHDLDTFMNQVRYMEYLKSTRQNSRSDKIISEDNTLDSVDDMMNLIEKNQYKRKWGRLDNYLKKNKIKEYLQHLVSINTIPSNKYEYYSNKILHLLENKKLNSKIEYDEVNCKIIKIKIEPFDKYSIR